MAGMGRVLLTGDWEKMIENLVDSYGGKYKMTRSPLSENEFVRLCEQNKPHVVIICLDEETSEITHLKTACEGIINKNTTTTFVIGHKDDVERFQRKISIQDIEIFLRPLDNSGFSAAMARKIEQALKNEEALLRTTAQVAMHIPATNSPTDTPPAPARAAAPTMAPPTPRPSTPRPTAAAHHAAERTAAAPRPRAATPIEIPDGFELDDVPLTPAQIETEKKLKVQIERMTALYGRMSVLVVDDDVRMLNVAKMYLQDLYDITVVPTAKLAVKFLAQKHADMVLLDYMMPEMDGPTLLRHIRTESNCKNIPVLFLTGVSDRASIQKTLGFSPNGYLLKPVTRLTLLERVTEQLLGLH